MAEGFGNVLSVHHVNQSGLLNNNKLDVADNSHSFNKTKAPCDQTPAEQTICNGKTVSKLSANLSFFVALA